MGSIAASTLLVVLVGCAPQPAKIPPPPTHLQLQALMSLAQTKGITDDEYSRLGISLSHVVADKEWVGVMTDCLRDSGIGGSTRFIEGDIELLPLPSGVSGPGSVELETCSLQYPQATLANGLRTRAQWGYEYDYLVNSLTPCLRAKGFTVPKMPKRTDFIGEGIRAAVPPSPYDRVHLDLASAAGKSLLNQCPPEAPGF